MLDLIHPAIAEYMEAEAEGGRGRSVLEGLSELPAPARLGRRLAGKGTSTTFPGSRQEAIGQFVVDSAYLRKASMEAISEKAYRRGSPEERLQHRINSLREDSLEYGMGEPPPEVIRGRELKTRLDAIPDGTSYRDRLQIALQLVGDTTPVGSLAEPRAKELYYRFPEVQLGMYNRWQSMLEKVEDARIDARG